MKITEIRQRKMKGDNQHMMAKCDLYNEENKSHIQETGEKDSEGKGVKRLS